MAFLDKKSQLLCAVFRTSLCAEREPRAAYETCPVSPMMSKASFLRNNPLNVGLQESSP